MEADENVLANFAQKLAGNEKKTRDKAIKKLRRWISSRMTKNNGMIFHTHITCNKVRLPQPNFVTEL